MANITGLVRHTIEYYNMIQEGDNILIAVSGGKDSVVLLAVLAQLQKYYPKHYTVQAVTLSLGFQGTQSLAPIEKLCAQLGIPYMVRETNIANVVFENRKEPNPCSLCSRMRNGILHDIAKEQGCNKIATGHTLDDAAETFMMNLAQRGHLSTFSPVTYLDRKDLHLIRPLVFVKEKQIRQFASKENLPIISSGCPVDGETHRQKTKLLLENLEETYPNFQDNIIAALKKSHLSRW